jgi:hypothetical protein
MFTTTEDRVPPKPSISCQEWQQAKNSFKNSRPSKKVRKLIKKARQARKRVYS